MHRKLARGSIKIVLNDEKKKKMSVVQQFSFIIV